MLQGQQQERFATLLDLWPPLPKTSTEYQLAIKEAEKTLVQNGRTQATRDEILFAAFLLRLSGVLDKATTMLCQEKFTVAYHGDLTHPFVNLTDYEIMPLNTTPSKEGEGA